MFYVNQEDEDGDFNVESGGSKLANLFSSDQVSNQKQSPSLTYTAPKQPKKTDGQLANAGASLTALHAVAVHAYKFKDQQYSSQGKLGAALIGSHETSVYKILLYKGKQQQVTSASLSPNFSFKIQANNYANFYDDKRENWSVMFDSEQNSVEFAKQVALAKANSAGGNLNSVVVQDLALGEGQEVAMGDAVEIRFTGWLLTNHTFGQVFDSNVSSETLLRMKLGKSKVIKGWEDGLIGSKKNCRKILVVPPSLGYGNQGIPDKVPPISTLIFDIFVNKVKFSSSKDGSRSSTPSALDSDTPDGKRGEQSPRTHSGSFLDDSIRSRGASLSEQMSNSPKSDKAKIISRMAKMGMPMLPMQGAVPAQPSSESDLEDEGQQSKGAPTLPPRTSSPKLPPKPRTSSFNHSYVGIQEHLQPSALAGIPPPVQQVALLQPQQQYSSGIPFGYPVQQAGPMALYQQQPFPVPDAHLPVLLSETRMYNSEVRMTLGKILERVDTLGNKIGEGQGGSKHIESNALLQNIQRIVEENTKLKDEVDEKNLKIQKLNEKISDLLLRNNKFVEESNLMLEKKSDSLQSSTSLTQARLLALEQDRVKLSGELSEALSTITSLQLELQKKEQTLKQHALTASEELQKHREDVQNLETVVNDLESQLSGLQGDLKSGMKEKETLTSTVDTLKLKLSEVHLSKENLEENVKQKLEQLGKLQHENLEELQRAKILHRQEIETLKSKLAEKLQDNSLSESELSALTEQLSSLTAENQRLKDATAELDEQVQSLRLTYDGERKSAAIWKTKHDKLQDSFSHLAEEYKKVLRSLPSEQVASSHGFEIDLKRAMNGLYRSLQRVFEKEQSYGGNEILSSILSSIRVVTAAVLEEKQSSGAEDEHDKRDDAKETDVSTSEETPVATIPEVSSSSSEDTVVVLQENAESQIPDIAKNANETPHTDATPVASNIVDETHNSEGSSAVAQNREEAADQADCSHSNPEVINTSKEDAESEKAIDRVSSTSPDKKNSKQATASPPTWRPQPPPPPLFDDDEDEDDWLK